MPPENRLDVLAAYDASMCFQPTPADVPYLDRVLLVASTGGSGTSGCPHRDVAIDLSAALLARPYPPQSIHPCLEIALVDALLRPARISSADCVTMRGTIRDKAKVRAELLASAAIEALNGYSDGDRRRRVLLVGAVGSVIEELGSRGLEVDVTEMDQTLIGQRVAGVVVRDSSHTAELIVAADCAVVTGMILATQTLGLVLDAAQDGGTPLVFYAQSAANILKTIPFPTPTTIVDEVFPHYMWPGLSEVEVSTTGAGRRSVARTKREKR